MTTRKNLGNRGETAAAAYLKQQGYTIVAANWRCAVGEFDLIAQQGETLVFVEVRTRRGGIDAALESITPRKRAILERLAYIYLDENTIESDWRIDVIAVTYAQGKPIIEHAENALDW
jgi:putative endonuclease